MEIRSLEIDLDNGVLNINGQKMEQPIKVELPGPDGWTYRKLFNGTVGLGEYDRIEVTYKKAINNKPL